MAKEGEVRLRGPESHKCRKNEEEQTADDADKPYQGSVDTSESLAVAKEDFSVEDKETAQEEQQRPNRHKADFQHVDCCVWKCLCQAHRHARPWLEAGGYRAKTEMAFCPLGLTAAVSMAETFRSPTTYSIATRVSVSVVGRT